MAALDSVTFVKYFQEMYDKYSKSQGDRLILFEIVGTVPVPLPINSFSSTIYLNPQKAYILLRHYQRRFKLYLCGNSESQQYRAALGFVRGKSAEEKAFSELEGSHFEYTDQWSSSYFSNDVAQIMESTEKLLAFMNEEKQLEYTAELAQFICNYYQLPTELTNYVNFYTIYQINLETGQIFQFYSTALILFDDSQTHLYFIVYKGSYQQIGVEKLNFQQRALFLNFKHFFGNLSANDSLLEQLYHDANADAYYYDFNFMFEFPKTNEARLQLKPELELRFGEKFVESLYEPSRPVLLQVIFDEFGEIESTENIDYVHYMQLSKGHYIIQNITNYQYYAYFRTDERSSQLISYAFEKNFEIVYEDNEPFAFTLLFGTLPTTQNKNINELSNSVDESEKLETVDHSISTQLLQQVNIQQTSDIPKNFKLFGLTYHSAICLSLNEANVVDQYDYTTTSLHRVLSIFSSNTQCLIYSTSQSSITGQQKMPDFYCFVIRGIHSLAKQMIFQQNVIKDVVGASSYVIKTCEQFFESDFLINEFDILIQYVGSNTQNNQWKFRAISKLCDRDRYQIFVVKKHFYSNKVLVFQELIVFENDLLLPTDPLYCYIIVDKQLELYTFVCGDFAEQQIKDLIYSDAAQALCVDDFRYIDSINYQCINKELRIEKIVFSIRNIGLKVVTFKISIENSTISLKPINYISQSSGENQSIYLINYQNFCELLLYIPQGQTDFSRDIKIIQTKFTEENLLFKIIDLNQPINNDIYMLQNLLYGFFGIGYVFETQQPKLDIGMFFGAFRKSMKEKLQNYQRLLFENELDDKGVLEYEAFERLLKQMKSNPEFEQEQFDLWFKAIKQQAEQVAQQRQNVIWGVELEI